MGLITTPYDVEVWEIFILKCFHGAGHPRRLNALLFIYNDHFKKMNIYGQSSLHVILYGGAARLVMSLDTLRFALMCNK